MCTRIIPGNRSHYAIQAEGNVLPGLGVPTVCRQGIFHRSLDFHGLSVYATSLKTQAVSATVRLSSCVQAADGTPSRNQCVSLQNAIIALFECTMMKRMFRICLCDDSAERRFYHTPVRLSKNMGRIQDRVTHNNHRNTETGNIPAPCQLRISSDSHDPIARNNSILVRINIAFPAFSGIKSYPSGPSFPFSRCVFLSTSLPIFSFPFFEHLFP